MKSKFTWLCITFFIMLPGTVFAADAVWVVGDIKVDGIHFGDGSTLYSSNDLMRNKGNWSPSALYSAGDVVQSGGSSYVCTSANTSLVPPNTLYWSALAVKGADGGQGPQGVQGTQGPAGPPGPTGPAGVATAPPVLSILPSYQDAFLLIDGIPGDSNNATHRNWIQVGAYSLDASGRKLSVMFTPNRSVPPLLDNAAKGSRISRAELQLCQAGGSQLCQSAFVLGDVLVDFVSLGPEQVVAALSSRSITVSYKPIKPDGTLDSAVQASILGEFGAMSQQFALPNESSTVWDLFAHIGDIRGESNDAKHRYWSNASGMLLKVSGPMRDGSGKPIGKTRFDPLLVVKAVDKSTPLLIQGMSKDINYAGAEIDVCRPGGDQLCALRIDLAGVRLTSFDQQMTVSEHLTLEYERIQVTFVDDTGLNYSFGWDVPGNSPL